MKFGLLTFLILTSVVAVCGQSSSQETHSNVNSRYKVETIELSSPFQGKLSDSLRERIESMIGSSFNQDILEELARSIRREIHERTVTMRVTRGSMPETVKVVFDITERKEDEDDVSPRFIYHSKQNFSFGADGTWKNAGHVLRAGLLTDNDELLERFSGIRGSYERERLAGGHLAFKVEAESFRAQWNGAVRTASAENPEIPGIYRTRVHFEPSTTIKFIEPLTLQLGVSLQRLQMQYPTARHELASAAVATLRFRRRWELTPVNRQDVDASYDVRAGTGVLDSDFVYTRHHVAASYTFHGMHEEVTASFQGGVLNGNAPLFERFVLGNAHTLRGWNRFDLDPLGGDRMFHTSLDYRYRPLRIVYDAGSVWRHGADPVARHSIAIGIAEGTVMQVSLLVAFPIRNGAIEPIFITGLNF